VTSLQSKADDKETSRGRAQDKDNNWQYGANALTTPPHKAKRRDLRYKPHRLKREQQEVSERKKKRKKNRREDKGKRADCLAIEQIAWVMPGQDGQWGLGN